MSGLDGRAPRVERLIALGASNLTRGLPIVLRLARQAFGEPLAVVAALGLGRSYGQRSSIPNPRLRLRALPGILQSALFETLEASPRLPTRALVTDVGNDVAYGVPVDVIVAWVEECVTRLQALGADVVLTGLPLHSLARLTPARFAFFRALLLPSCRLSLREVGVRAEAVSAALRALARRRGARFVELRGEWYGVDPIHVRPRCWEAAWSEIMLGDQARAAPSSGATSPPIRATRVWRAAPERQWLCGAERRRAQPALTAGSTRVSFY